MSFDVDVEGRRGEARIAARFVAGPGVTVLVGPSGVGKTSVLHMMAGLVRPERGHVRVGGVTLFDAGVDVPVERRRAGYVFQEPRLFPHLSVRANLLYGSDGPKPVRAELVEAPPFFRVEDDPLRRRLRRRSGQASASSGRTEGGLERVVAMLDIKPLLDRWPRTLSGGEARRVAIGRALLSDPAFLLLDEPLSSLDPVRREEAARAIERVRDEAGLPILMVTHDEREAERLGTAVVLG